MEFQGEMELLIADEIFIAYKRNEAIGFAQIHLRFVVEGTDSTPVGYLEM